LIHGVRFSVQTVSLGSEPYRSEEGDERRTLVGKKVWTGLVVTLLSMKLSELQKSPERELINLFQFSSALQGKRREDSERRRPEIREIWRQTWRDPRTRQRAQHLRRQSGEEAPTTLGSRSSWRWRGEVR